MKGIVCMCLFILMASCVSASGRTESRQADHNPPSGDEALAGTPAVIIGRVVIFGNEPHTFAGIVTDDGAEYAVYPPSLETELRSLQGNNIEFNVILLDEPQGYGSLFLKGGTVSPLSWKILD